MNISGMIRVEMTEKGKENNNRPDRAMIRLLILKPKIETNFLFYLLLSSYY
jgi:hypothetical protein